jgi:hypothetical protein
MMNQRCQNFLAWLGVLSAGLLLSIASTLPAAVRTAQAEGTETAEEQSGGCVLQRGTVRMEGISSEQVELDYRGSSLIIRITESGERLTFDGFDRNAPYAELGRFDFEDGTYCTADLVERGFDLDGTEAAEIVLGTDAADRIRGGAGNDTLDGAGGDDSYLYARGDGIDCINDPSGRTNVAFESGVLPQDLQLEEGSRGKELTLFVRLVPETNDQPSEGLEIRLQAPASASQLQFQFADGSVLMWKEIQAAAERASLRKSAVELKQACHFDTRSAERAGLQDRRVAR